MNSTDTPEQDAAYWGERSEEAEQSGDYLGACDAALMGLEDDPHARELQYRAVLNLSRSGARRRAPQLWLKYRLGEAATAANADSKLEIDIASLGARLDREAALAAGPADRMPKLRAAALRYEAVYHRTGSTFPGINAAVLHRLSGAADDAGRLAASIIEACDRTVARNEGEVFNLEADRAAASLLLGRESAARNAIDAAAALSVKPTSIASTRRQLLMLCENMQIDPAIVAPLKNRPVVFYCGAGGSLGDAHAGIGAIGSQVTARRVGYGYGSLADDGEIAVAQALLDASADLTAILPFKTHSYVAGHPAAGAFLQRNDASVQAGRCKLVQATDGEGEYDAKTARFVHRLAMGMAILRAETLGSDVLRLRLDDDLTSTGPGAQEADEWDRRGLPTVTIPIGAACTPPSRDPLPAHRLPSREMRFIMFGDFEHFSRLGDGQMLIFYERMMGRVAAVLDRYDDRLLARNTWGDGLYLVLDDIVAAARCALEIQAELQHVDLVAAGLPPTLALRLALDAGAVFEVRDPILKALAFAGSHICRSARLEPRTPPGEVYVTETFAALLSICADTGLTCDYVGSMKAAKDFGRVRTYLLRST